MHFPLFIARRYLISKKSHNIINLISGVSLVGIATGTAALIIVLSVFNGFESLVKSLFSVFDPDLKITAIHGKSFANNAFDAHAIQNMEGVISYTEVVEENALLRYNQQQYLATIKGVDSLYQKKNPIDTLLVNGEMVLQDSDQDFAIPGYGIAYSLGLDMNDPKNYISVYIPKRTGNFSGLPDDAFNSELIKPIGIFSIQQDFDDKYMLVPLRFARRMLDYTNEVTSIEVRLAKNTDNQVVRSKIREITGSKFKVQTRFEQQEMLYKIMKSEKWGVFLILTFILIVASFNVIGSLTMLILDKLKDIGILRSMGANEKTIRQIFFAEGLLVNLAGAILGLLLGLLVCYLQQSFGFVKLQSSGSFIINAYPVKMQALDFVYVFITVSVIGIIAAWIPASRIGKIKRKEVV